MESTGAIQSVGRKGYRFGDGDAFGLKRCLEPDALVVRPQGRSVMIIASATLWE